MASLSSIVTSRNVVHQNLLKETNIETGVVSVFIPHSTQYTDHHSLTRTWSSPNVTGTVVVELWGASGSAPGLHRCGLSIPGNPGAYSKKTFILNGNTLHFSTNIGVACNNEEVSFSGGNSYKGTSGPTCLCWCLGSANGTVCAGGGRGGVGWCSDGSTTTFCCAIQANYCHTNFCDLPRPYYHEDITGGNGQGCGMICNILVASDPATASGGDLNLSGGISCSLFGMCNQCCKIPNVHFVKTSPYRFSKKGVMLINQHDECNMRYNFGGEGPSDLLQMLGFAGRTPSPGPLFNCWGATRVCGCNSAAMRYQDVMPYGVPANASGSQNDAYNYGARGGPGAVKIVYRGT